MKSIVKGAALPAALCLMMGSAQAADGLLIVEKTTANGSSRTSQTQIEHSRMRAEIVAASGERQIVMFDGTKQVLTIINPENRTYSEMTKADMDRFGAQASDAIAQVQASLATLPPAQRAQV